MIFNRLFLKSRLASLQLPVLMQQRREGIFLLESVTSLAAFREQLTSAVDVFRYKMTCYHLGRIIHSI